MIDYQLVGIVGLEFKGEYEPTTRYTKGDVVSYNGSSYACATDETTGNLPTNENYWQLMAKAGEKGEKGEQGEQGEQGEKGDAYIVTDEDLQEIARDITDNANSEFNKNVENKTKEFNESVSGKIDEYNANATEKIEAYNQNHTTKLKEYDDNTVEKVDNYNTNAVTKTTEYNNNHTNKINVYNGNASNKIEVYDTNATTKLEEYNTNANEKMEEFDALKGSFINKISVNGIPQTIINNAVDLRIDNRTVYGIERTIADNSSSAWDRTDSAVGLVANATKDGSEVQNDFDNIYPWSAIKTVNYDTVEDMIVATIGDDNFKFDGSNGQVMTVIPEFYYKYWRDDTREHLQISGFAIEGFTKSPAFMVARYVNSAKTMNPNEFYSESGTFPYLSYAYYVRQELNRIGKDWQVMDYRYSILQMLYLVEYADYNSQAMLGQGVCDLTTDDNNTALIAEENTNHITLDTVNANKFKIGQTVSIGTANYNDSEIANNRIITSIETHTEGLNGMDIYFDGDPVNIAVGNILYSQPIKSGQCDSLGMKSGCFSDDGKSSMIYRGIENI